MQLSAENLARLDTLEYRELGNLEAIEVKARRYSFIFIGLALVAAYITGWVYLIKYVASLGKSAEGWMPCLFMAPFYLALLIAVPVGTAVEWIFNKIYSVTGWSRRQRYLKEFFEPIERHLEGEAITILDSVKTASVHRDRTNALIRERLRLKRKWQPEYKDDLAEVRNNCDLNSSAIDLIDEHLPFVKFNLPKQKEYVSLRSSLVPPYRDYIGLSMKLRGLYGRPDSIKLDVPEWIERLPKGMPPAPRSYTRTKTRVARTGSSNPLGIWEAPEAKPTQAAPRTGDHNKARSNPLASPKPTQQQQISFDDKTSDTVAKPKSFEDVPQQRIGPKHRRISKISENFNKRLSEIKADVGKRGELLALELERQRVIREEGKEYLHRLEHTSAVHGDGFGYDILSVKDGKDIYIEVKTTTGSFWSNLFFTRNEYEQLGLLGEQYYLYRICDLDLETNLGDLFVFDGAEKIHAYFDFDANVYVLRQREGN